MAEEDVIIRLGLEANRVVEGLAKIQDQLTQQNTAFATYAAAATKAFDAISKGTKDSSEHLISAVSIGTLFGNKLTDAFNAVVDGIKSAVEALPELVKHVAEAGDRFLTMSAQTGVSVEALSQFQFVAGQANTSVETITSAIFLMQRQIGAGTPDVERALNRLSLNLDTLKKGKPEDAFTQILDRLGKLPSASDRARVGFEIFGRQFRSISQLAVEDMTELMHRADAMGLTITKAQAQMADRFNDAKNLMSLALEGFQRQIGFALLPAVTAITEAIAKVFERMTSTMVKSTEDMRTGIQQQIRLLLELFGNLVVSLGPVITRLASLSVDILKSLMGTFSGWLTEQAGLVGAAFVIFDKLADRVGGKTKEAADALKPFVVAFAALSNGVDGFKSSLDKLDPILKSFADKAGKSLEQFKADLLKAFDDFTKGGKKTGDDINKSLSPELEALQKDVDILTKQIRLATEAVVPASIIFLRFGDAAGALVDKAKLIPGGLALVTSSIKAMGAAFEDVQIQKINDGIERAATQGRAVWADFSGAVDVLTDRVGKDILKVSDLTIDFTNKLRVATKVGLDATLEGIDQQERAALAALATMKNVSAGADAAIRAFFADAREAARGFTGDVERDLAAIGITSKRILLDQLIKIQNIIDNLKLHPIGLTPQQQAKMQQMLKDAEDAFDGTIKWFDALDAVGKAWESVGAVAGQTLASITRGIATATTSLVALNKSQEAYRKAQTESGIKGALGQIAAISGMIGAAIQIGQTIFNGLKAIFSKPEWKKIARDAGRDFGVTLSDSLSKAIEETEKKEGVGRVEATLLHLGDIITEQGGLSAKNLTMVTGKIHDLFSGIQRGSLTTEQATKVIDQVWPQMTALVLKHGGLITTQMLELIKLNKQFGTSSEEMQKFVNEQFGKLAGGLLAVVGNLPDLLKVVGEAPKEFTTSEQIQAWINAPEQVAKIKKAAADTQEEFDRLSRISLAAFNQMIASGKTSVEAISALGPVIDRLKKSHDELGLAGSVAYDRLARLNTLVHDNASLVASVGSLNDVLLALANTGEIDADTFADLEAQGKAGFDKLIAAGFEQNEALAQMAPFLKTLIKLHNERGLAIDDETQKLIAQAAQQGILGEDQETIQDVLKAGLTEIIKALKGDLPAAWKQAADAAEREGERMRRSLEGIGDEADRAARGASPGGIQEITTQLAAAGAASDTFLSRFGRNMVNAKQLAEGLSVDSTLVSSAAFARTMTALRGGPAPEAQPMSGYGGVHVHLDNLTIKAWDRSDLRAAVERDVMPLIAENLEDSVRGETWRIRRALGMREAN